MHAREASKRESEIRQGLLATRKLLTQYLEEYQKEAKTCYCPVSVELLQRTEFHLVTALDALYRSSFEREKFFITQEKELSR